MSSSPSNISDLENSSINDEICQKIRTGEYRLLKPTKNSKSLKSAAWETWYWIYDEDEDVINGKIACINCKTVKDYKSTEGTTTLIKHKDKCLNTVGRKSLSALSKNEETTVKSLVKKKVVQFVSQDLRSFRTPSCPGFFALADSLIAVGHRYGPLKAVDILPNRTSISKLVSKDAEEERFNLKMTLTEIQSQGLSITLDLWTEDITKCHYIGMNVHYIIVGVLKEATLCVKELDELSANAENIHIEIINMLTLYEVDINNVIFVTDRGSEIIAALKDVAFRLNCGDHILKNIVDEMFNKISQDNLITTLMTNCRRLIKYVKQSKIQYQLPNGLKNEVQSRWNATLTMLKSIKKAQERNELSQLLAQKGKSFLLTDIDMDLLCELENLLDPFLEATLCMEAKSKATIHYVALYRMKLERHLSENAFDVPEIAEMKNIGLLYMRDKWVLDDIHKKAVFFHPKLKHLNMFRHDKDRLIADIRGELQMINASEEDDSAESHVSPPKRRKQSVSEVQERDSIVDEFFNADFTSRLNDDVQKYLDSPVIVPHGGQIDLCEWWFVNRKFYPTLYKLSLKYLCVPAASATAETKFSLAGFLVNERRSSLNPSVVDDILILKSAFDSKDLLD